MTGWIEEIAAIADAVRVPLYWEDGMVETAHEPIDAGVTLIIRQAKDGRHRHFEVTDDLDADSDAIAPRVARRPRLAWVASDWSRSTPNVSATYWIFDMN